MTFDFLKICINNIEENLPEIIKIVQMPISEIVSYMSNNSNILTFRQSLLALQRECVNIKNEFITNYSQKSDQQFDFLKEKNLELINMQNKLADNEKLFSDTKLEIAELKKAIAVQEALNAQLTAENLILKNSSKPSQNIFQDHDTETLKIENETLKVRLNEVQTRLEEKEKLFNRSQQKLQDHQTKLDSIENKMNLKFERMEMYNKQVFQLKERLLKYNKQMSDVYIENKAKADKKINTLNKKIFELKSKLLFMKDVKSENRILNSQFENFINLLEFAMQSMANLAGVSAENKPSAFEVMENGELLSKYLADLQAKILEKAMELSPKPEGGKKKNLSVALDQINDLMCVMTEQMQSEHEALMNQISNDKELPSFRKTISRHVRYD